MLSRRYRLSDDKAIRAVLRLKQWRGDGALLSFVAKENKGENSKLAVVTPKKLGNAVTRNRLKRLCCSAFLAIAAKLPRKLDLVLFPKPAALDKKSEYLAQQTLSLLSNNIV